MPSRRPWSSSGSGSTSCGLSWLLQPARVARRGRAGRADSFQVSDAPHSIVGRCRPPAGGCTVLQDLSTVHRACDEVLGSQSTLHSVHRRPTGFQAMHTSQSAQARQAVHTRWQLKLQDAVSRASHSSCPTQGRVGPCLLPCRPWPLHCALHRPARWCQQPCRIWPRGPALLKVIQPAVTCCSGCGHCSE